MTKHSVFGSDPFPATLGLYNDGAGVLDIGNVFYVYGGATGYTCTGAKLWMPDGVTLPAQVTIEARYHVTQTANNLDTAPLRQVTVDTTTGPGWLEVLWTPFALASGENILISYHFVAAGEAYLYALAPDSNYILASDGSNIALSESVDAARGAYYCYNSGTVYTPAYGTFYGVDIIVDDGLTPLPLAEYGFNETSGTIAYDSSVNSRDLTVNSALNFNVSREGNGLHQVGGGSENKITNPAAWLETTSRTVMFWGRRGSEGADVPSNTVYQLDGSGNTVFGISLSNGADATFTVRQNTTPVTITTTEMALGDWHHYALTYDQQAVRAYIDAVLVSEQLATGSIDTSDGNIYFYGEDYQQQVIDDLRFFDKAVKAVDIAAYMNEAVETADIEPPTTPLNIQAVADYQSITVTWDAATDNVAIQNYVVYRGTTSDFIPAPTNQVGGPNTTTFVQTVAVGTYYYKVAARDEAGNESTVSLAVSATATHDPVQDYLYPSGLGWGVGDTYADPASSGFSLGGLFAVSDPASIKGLRFYAVRAMSACEARLFESATEVAVKTEVSLVPGWNTILFDTPFVAVPGIDYIVSLFQPGPDPVAYTAQLNMFTATRTQVGPAYSQTDIAGRYGSGPGYPVGSSSAWYGVDVIVDSRSPELDTSFGATIVLENNKPGALGSEWSIGGAGDLSNLGFARQFSVNVGETIDFSCHGSGTVLDIYRIGYYGGMGWRKVASLTNAATDQPDPDIIPNSNGGVTCTNWSVTASWTVPSVAMSGLFVGVYRNTAGNNASYIPFCVRDDAKEVDIIIKLSDTTWALAYNYYGTPAAPLTGKSLYGSGGPMGDIATRAHAATYHRPIVTRAGIEQTYWLACEAPLIRYLEDSGYNIKYVASKDVDANAAVLSNAKMMISSGHDEYWSQGMRDAVEAYRDAGKHVLFMSGNEVFWRTRFSPDGNTMWCYKDTMTGPGGHIEGTPLDPVSWTGTWKDTRWVDRRPEYTITGTEFRMNGVNDYAAVFSHVADYASHPVWRDSTLSSADVTIQGMIGFEADEIRPTQPEGSSVVLAQHTVNIDGKRADDNGQEYNGNGDLNWGVVSQRYASGAVVVGFGTCQWAWGLDDVHDRPIGTAASSSIQQMTSNLLADLGAMPATLRSGVVAPTPAASLDIYGLVPAPTLRSGKVKVWDGAGWQPHPLKVWDGSQWVTRPVSGHDGSGFVVGK
jgi:hypothetical protein